MVRSLAQEDLHNSGNRRDTVLGDPGVRLQKHLCVPVQAASVEQVVLFDHVLCAHDLRCALPPSSANRFPRR